MKHEDAMRSVEVCACFVFRGLSIRLVVVAVVRGYLALVRQPSTLTQVWSSNIRIKALLTCIVSWATTKNTTVDRSATLALGKWVIHVQENAVQSEIKKEEE